MTALATSATPKNKPLISGRTSRHNNAPLAMSAICGYCSLMGQEGERLFWVSTLWGCLGSLRARSALDGVSWVQRGSVEIAFGHRLTGCYKIRAVVCSLPRASLLLGAGFGLLSGRLRGLRPMRTRFRPAASRA
jgi:hypothetical protein